MRDCGSSSFTPISTHPFSTAGVRGCGSSSFTPISYSSFFNCGSAGVYLLFPLRECGTAGAVVLPPFHTHPHFILILFPLRECGTAGAVVLPPFHILAFSTAGVRDCGSSSFIPISYTSFFHCGSAGSYPHYSYPHLILILFPLRECGTHIHPFPTVGVREQQFYPHFIYLLFPLRECGTAGAVVLSPFHIHPFSTAGVREQ